MEQLVLVPPRAPAAVDVERDPVVGGVGGGLAKGPEQVGIEVGDAGILLVEHRHPVRQDPVPLAPTNVPDDAVDWCATVAAIAAAAMNRATTTGREVRRDLGRAAFG